MATEQPEHATEHRHERPEDWGWHAEMGKVARITGWIMVVVMLTFLTSTHEVVWEHVWLIGFTAALVVSLLWDRHRRKNAWRG